MTDLSDLINEANSERELSTRDISAAAQRAGLKMSHATAGKVLKGTHGRIDMDTVLALEAVFKIPRDRITAAANVPPVGGPYEPPREGAMLSPRQRKAISELILSIVSEGGQAHGNAAPTTQPGEPGPDNVTRLSPPSSTVRGDRRSSKKAVAKKRPAKRGVNEHGE